MTHCLDRLGLGLSRNTGASGNAWDSSSRLISALQPEGTRRSPSCRSRDGGEGTGLWLRDTAFPQQPEGEAAGLISLQGPYRWARPTWSPRVWKPRGWADTWKRARRGSVSPGAAGATPPLLEGSMDAELPGLDRRESTQFPLQDGHAGSEEPGASPVKPLSKGLGSQQGSKGGAPSPGGRVTNAVSEAETTQ